MRYFKDALTYVHGEGLKRTSLAFSEKVAGFFAEGEELSLPADAVVLPGFLEEHVHGAGGGDTMDGSEDSLLKMAETLASEGVTGFLGTTMTQSHEVTLRALTAAARYRAREETRGAALLGLHLEGPFLSPKYSGAQPKEHLKEPDAALFEEYFRASGGCVRIVTLAPEREGTEALIHAICAHGVVFSVGHTAATYADMTRALSLGAKQVTHVFNAQSPMHHRDLGTAGTALLERELGCELICDGLHVSVPAMRLLFACKPPEKVTLITDGMRAKGLGDGVSELGGQTVTVRGGVARLADGTLAGSLLKMNEAVKIAVNEVKVPLLQAVDCASANPARTLGLYGQKGLIAPGADADFAVLDEAFNVLMTVRGGRIVYRRAS